MQGLSRKFRSQISDNMVRRKAEVGRVREEKRREAREEKRREETRRRREEKEKEKQKEK